ncbi:hypothetical protein SESBI_45524, partial [Sesbania bispinosa]
MRIRTRVAPLRSGLWHRFRMSLTLSPRRMRRASKFSEWIEDGIDMETARAKVSKRKHELHCVATEGKREPCFEEVE